MVVVGIEYEVPLPNIYGCPKPAMHPDFMVFIPKMPQSMFEMEEMLSQ
jgi:hypothetical protein